MLATPTRLDLSWTDPCAGPLVGCCFADDLARSYHSGDADRVPTGRGAAVGCSPTWVQREEASVRPGIAALHVSDVAV